MVAVVPDRRQATVKGFLEAMPAPLKATIQTGGIDREEGYAKAVSEALPGVKVVVDRFDRAPHDPAGGDRLRKPELKRPPQERPEAEYEPSRADGGWSARIGRY